MREEKLLFCEHLGRSPTIKILDFLITGRNFDFTITDIIRGANVGTEQAYEVVRRLEKLGLIRRTRKIGNYQLYQINKDNAKANKLIRFYLDLIKENTRIKIEV